MTELGETSRPGVRILQVAGLAVIALVLSVAFGNLEFGLISAAAIVVGELVWSGGALVLRSLRRRHSEA